MGLREEALRAAASSNVLTNGSNDADLRDASRTEMLEPRGVGLVCRAASPSIFCTLLRGVRADVYPPQHVYHPSRCPRGL